MTPGARVRACCCRLPMLLLLIATTSAQIAAQQAPAGGFDFGGLRGDAQDEDPAATESPETWQLIFADDFDPPSDYWATDGVSSQVSEGSLYFSTQPDESLMLLRPLPMDGVAVEFSARVPQGGIDIYLIKSQEEALRWSLGADANQRSALYDSAGGEALASVDASAYTPGQWHTWRLERRGSAIEARRDGGLLIASDSARVHNGEGLLAFMTDGAGIGMAQLRIYALGGGEEAAADGYEPLPLAEDSAVKQAVICLGFDDRGGLVGVQDVYPDGTEKVALYLELRGAAPNTEFEVVWHHDGRILAREIMLASGNRKTISHLYAVNRETLWTGSYAVEIRENGRLVARRVFSIR